MTDPTDPMETAREIADQFAALTVTDHNVRRAFAETCAEHIATALTAAERRGMERAAEWHNERAAAYLPLADNDDPRPYIFHRNAAAAIRALTQGGDGNV